MRAGRACATKIPGNFSRDVRRAGVRSDRIAALAGVVTTVAVVVVATRGAPREAAAAVPWDACPDVEIEEPSRIAPPRWDDCGPGCRRLAVDWGPTPAHRLYGALGASDGFRRVLAFGRDRGETQDLIVVEMLGAHGADGVAFAATMTRGFHGCMARVRAVDPTGALVELSTRAGGVRRRVLASVGARRSRLLSDDDSARGAVLTAMAAGRRASTRDRRTLEVDGRAVWTAPGGATIAQLAVGGDAVFAATTGAGGETLWAWTPEGGAVVLRAAAGAPAVGEGMLVWRERVGNGVAVMVSAVAATPQGLRPRALVTLPAKAPVAAVEHAVGGGRVVVLDRTADMRRLLVIDVRTGAITTPTAPAGLRWSTPLWTDREELAALADAPAHAYRRGDVVAGESFTVVRLTPDALLAQEP
jgi:hypothetical protein